MGIRPRAGQYSRIVSHREPFELRAYNEISARINDVPTSPRWEAFKPIFPTPSRFKYTLVRPGSLLPPIDRRTFYESVENDAPRD